jgi:hypothetical protein
MVPTASLYNALIKTISPIIMTIKHEQKAIFGIFNTARSQLPCDPHYPVNPPSNGCDPHHPVKPSSNGGLRRSYGEPSSPYDAIVRKGWVEGVFFCPDLQSLHSDDDCISLSSNSNASTSSGGSAERRVSFAAPLVTEVKTRPRTKDGEKKLLFYSQYETDW